MNYKDKHGNDFNPEIHQVNRDGQPRLNKKTGLLCMKPGPKKGSFIPSIHKINQNQNTDFEEELESNEDQTEDKPSFLSLTSLFWLVPIAIIVVIAEHFYRKLTHSPQKSWIEHFCVA